MLLRFDRNDSILRHTVVFELQQLLLVKRGQGRRFDVELQMNRGRDLVDVLSAGSLRTHRVELNLGIRDEDMGGNMQHRNRSLP